ncbi:hypothetical protein [Anaerosporobacter sp.]|uniref:hypothetical protein n=1 Tax=Anaerosporobacter sp. TaxID=1872529 RepID=UPI00286F1944|nr:hypothetical protein [Anaerosporobacter sp.]
MVKEHVFECKLVLPRKYYVQLAEEGKQLYEESPNGMEVAFPVELTEGITLADCVPAFVESVYLEFNPKYEITDSTEVTCELYKLGKTDEVFNLLVTITYPESEKEFHELLIFHQVELTEDCFTFELMGDQTMFNMEKY